MNILRPSRRQLMGASLIGGIAVYLAPLGSRAFAALFEEQLLTRPAWNDGVLKYRIDGTSKVTGEKVFARDIRARDMPHWPQQQSHALVLRVAMADRSYAGFDLSALSSDLAPDRVVTAADLARDGLAFPDFYGEDILLPEGKTPAYLGQAVAILIYRDFARWRFAKEKLQFNDAVIRYGAVTGPLQRDPWGSYRFVRLGGPTPYDDDVFSCLKQGPLSPSYSQHEPVWPKPGRDGDIAAQGMYYAKSIDDELAQPPADWLVLTRDYATQSGDTAALEPDNANGRYDREKEDLHLVVPTQSPQEVAAGAAAMLGKSRIGMKRLFLHPCFTVGYGSKDHCTMPYYGLVAAVYGDGRPVRLANDRFDQFQTGLKRHQFSMGYTVAVERKTGLLQSFRAEIVVNGGGRANCSVALTIVGAISAHSVYYFSQKRHGRDRDRVTRHRLRRGARLRRDGNPDSDRADDGRDRRRARPRRDRVPSAQRVEDRDAEHPRRDPARDATRRGGAGAGPRPCAVDRPRRAQAGLRRRAPRKPLRGRLRLHPATLRHRVRSEPRQA